MQAGIGVHVEFACELGDGKEQVTELVGDSFDAALLARLLQFVELLVELGITGSGPSQSKPARGRGAVDRLPQGGAPRVRGS